MVLDKDKSKNMMRASTRDTADEEQGEEDESSYASASGRGGVQSSTHGDDYDDGYDDDDDYIDDGMSYDGGDGSRSTDLGSHCDLGSSSNNTNGTNKNGNKKKNMDHDIPLASRETQAVNAGKCLVAGVLLLAAAGMAYLTYWFTTQDETDSFVISFNSFAQEIVSVADSNAQQTLSIIKSFSTATTSYAFRADLTWPFVTIPDFEVRAQEALQLSGAELILFTPIVSQLGGDAWGIYAIQNQDWITDGLAFQNKSDVDPGVVLPIIHSPTTGGSSGVQDSYAPLWQYAPAPTSAELVNLDMFQAFPWYKRLAKGINVVRHALLSEQVNVSYILPQNQNETSVAKTRMRSVTVHPIFESFDDNATILGLLAAIHPWDAYFANVLPPGTGRIDVEVKDTCGSAFTYAVHGAEVEFLGMGHLHSEKYNDFNVTAEFATFARVVGSNSGMNESMDHDPSLASCDYTLTIYPTDEFKASYASTKPIWYTSVVVLVFVFTAMVFVLYDWIVERRQAKVLSAAARTTAIIASLFPKQVQRRILQEAEEQALLDVQAARKARGAGGGGRGFNRAPKSELKEFLGDQPDKKESKDVNNNNSNNKKNSNVNNMRKGKAIADLFPNTTIMFADIVGFTAWSSAREPTQVFELLETIYGHFDAMAAHRRVFKVETVGDCYVAVAGLPEPRKDHAIIMSRFARDCVVTFGKVTRDLENSLGPDTGDLALRVGLHSGPVTAGVLRGERARFQLFGDTVNTTARMESNGKANKIQISQETADLLQLAGKSHWIQAREDLIKAKGKGELQTYWLIYKEGGDKNTSIAAVTMSNTPVDKSGQKVQMNVSLTAKHLRLVTWNRDLLAGKLNDVVARREACNVAPATSNRMRELERAQLRRQGMVLDEVAEIIELPKFVASGKYVDSNDIQLEECVLSQLENYIQTLSMMYRENPFHNFEHASHVTLSVSKLFSRIIAPDLEYDNKDGDEIDYTLHDHTYGITSDPLTQFAVLLSALIHDVDHVGVPNATLVQEKTALAEAYQNKSVAEQNSVDVAWRTLMDEQYADLRRTIYCNESEFYRFRQLLVNTVLATDIMDKDLKTLRNGRWAKAFSEKPIDEDVQVSKNRKATIVIEHLIQASDIAHTMQHWHVYRKWNERLYREMHLAYVNGRAEKDPADFWYQGEIGFFDFYIIPLAKKLADCGIFGVSSDEYLTYAIQNRREWEQRGMDVVATYKESLANEKVSGGMLNQPPSPLPSKETSTTEADAEASSTNPPESAPEDSSSLISC